MTVHLFIARLREGTVGEWKRVVHQFRVPPDDSKPLTELTAFCGASFVPIELELLTHISGMPCEGCFAANSKAAPEREPVQAVLHAVTFLEWWLPVNERTAGTEATESIKALMAFTRRALAGTDEEEASQ